jgi:2-oxoglutarate ferredoxin oxidoreductase subunit alpha
MITTDLIIGMAGSGGDGIVSAGESLISAAAREGYHAMMTKSFGSQIRGGESSCRVRLATTEILNPGGALDVAVALNWEDFLKFGAELPVSSSTVMIYEAATGIAPDQIPLGGVKPAEVFAVPVGTSARAPEGLVAPARTLGWYPQKSGGPSRILRKPTRGTIRGRSPSALADGKRR